VSARRPATGLARLVSAFVEFRARERTFLVVLLVGFLLVGATYRIPVAAAWVGFLFAGYSAIGNDSIQTIGTFIASNRDVAWWKQWMFMAAIFVATVGYSWLAYDGDVTYQRLASKGFESSPASFSFLQVAAPLFLLVLTRLRMPVSTTFLLLSSFATSAGSVGSVLSKSLAGYAAAFVSAIVLYLLVARAMARWERTPADPRWRTAQWLTSGVLWAVWLMQDASNIAVYLPRQLAFWQLAVFCTVIVLGLALLFHNGGERVQQVVDEKSSVVDVRSATVIDLIYAIVLLQFTVVSKVPMSTTWVFIGLLAGREIAMTIRGTTSRPPRETLRLVGKDLFYVTIGLLVSMALAVSVNEPFRGEVAAILGLG
jgi:hypothetical protein